MMVGENASPSANAGRIKCWHALQNTSRRPTSRESSSRKPVMCGSGSPGETCPVNGSHCSITPNTNSRISPQRNSGIDNSTIEARSATGSNNVPRRRNSNRPPPRPRIAAIAMAQAASWIVAGRVAATSVAGVAAQRNGAAEVAVQRVGRARSGIAAARAYRGPSRGACLRFPQSSRSAAATSPPDRPARAARCRTAAPRRSAGSGSPPASGARSV